MNCIFSISLLYFVLIPSTILCYLPMHNHLRISKRKLCLSHIVLFLVSIPIYTFLTLKLGVKANTIYIFCIIAYFFYYHQTLKVNLGISLSVYLFVIALMSFPMNLALTLDACIHPTETIYDYCIIGTGGQFSLCLILALMVSYFLYHYGSRFIDSLSGSKIWYLFPPISLCFLILNFLIEPRNYHTLHIGKVFRFYLAYILMSMCLYLFLFFIFYIAAKELHSFSIKMQQLDLQNLQEHQYLAQQQYLEETSRLRHDFRQSIFALNEMAARKEYASLTNYLSEYCKTLPVTSYKKYCDYNAVNALLNYYENLFRTKHIRMYWNIQLDMLENTISDIDFCGLLGNLLDNVQQACHRLPEDERYHRFSINIQQNTNLYIISVNSFDGIVTFTDGHYFSTKRKGNGIGLSSIAQTARKYGGDVRFSHKDNEFSIDVAMVLNP